MDSRPQSSSDAARAFSKASGYPIDPDSPVFVAKAILTTATLGAITGGTLGVLRSGNPYAFSINMGLNGGIVGLTFFGFREYLITPLLILNSSASHEVDSLSDKRLGKLPAGSTSSLSALRTNRLLDSALSGGLTGTILSSSLRGVRTAIPAFVTGGLIATSAQYAVNELRVVRLQLLARRVGAMDETAGTADMALSSPSTASAVGTGHATLPLPPGQAPVPTDPSRNALPSHTSAASQPHFDSSSTRSVFQDPQRPDGANSLPSRIMSTLSTFLPVRKLSDDEYLATLEKKRADVDRRLAEIAREEEEIFSGHARGSGAG